MRPSPDPSRYFSPRRVILPFIKIRLALDRLDIFQRLGHGSDLRAALASGAVKLAQQDQLVEVFRLLEALPGAVAEGAVVIRMGFHVMRDQEMRAGGDGIPQCR